MEGRFFVIVVIISFGMGVDKFNVRYNYKLVYLFLKRRDKML